MKYMYIVNAFNLGSETDKVIEKLKRLSQEDGREYEILLSRTPEDAGKLSERFRDSEAVVTAIGGDGSINRVLNQIRGTKNVLGFLPYGTGNDFYRACTEKLPDGIHETDIIRINDRYFINVACFGIDADIANNERFIHNHLIPKGMRYHAGVLYHFLTHRRGRRMKVEQEGYSLEKEWTTVIAANSMYYGGGYKVSPDSVIDDGCFEVYLVDDLGKVKMAEIILSMKKAGHLNNPALRHFSARKLIVSADVPFTANIDGEPLTADRFELEIIQKDIRIEVNRQFTERFLKK